MVATAFAGLDYQQQAALLLEEGNFLHSRYGAQCIVDLYELDELFVEVYYRLQNEELVTVLTYAGDDRLQLMLSACDFPSNITMYNNTTFYKQPFSYA